MKDISNNCFYFYSKSVLFNLNYRNLFICLHPDLNSLGFALMNVKIARQIGRVNTGSIAQLHRATAL